MYWILWYTHYRFLDYEHNRHINSNAKKLDVLDEDVVREEKTNKIALFTNKETAEEEAEKLITPYRFVDVVPQELNHVDSNYYKIVDR